MSVGLADTTLNVSASTADLNSTSTDLSVIPVKPIDVLRFGVIVTSSTATGTSLNLQLVKYPVAGNTSNPEVIASLSPSATVSQGEGLYMDVVVDASPADGDQYGKVKVDPGEEIKVEVETAGAASSTGQLFVESVARAFQGTDSRLSAFTEVAQ